MRHLMSSQSHRNPKHPLIITEQMHELEFCTSGRACVSEQAGNKHAYLAFPVLAE